MYWSFLIWRFGIVQLGHGHLVEGLGSGAGILPHHVDVGPQEVIEALMVPKHQRLHVLHIEK